MKRTAIKKRPLSDTVIANLEPEIKEYNEVDSKGLYLFIRQTNWGEIVENALQG